MDIAERLVVLGLRKEDCRRKSGGDQAKPISDPAYLGEEEEQVYHCKLKIAKCKIQN